MTDHSKARQSLLEAIGKVLDRKARGMDIVDVCAALGILAASAVAVTVPAGNPAGDLILAETLGFSFGEALKAARQARAN